MGTTTFTGPIKAGNVLNSDGTNVLAGAGGDSGIANVGYAVMAQSEAITQATNGATAGVYTTSIVIPADSQILSITLTVSAVWSGAATTLGIGTTASATALTAAAAVAGGTRVSSAPVPALLMQLLPTGRTLVRLTFRSWLHPQIRVLVSAF